MRFVKMSVTAVFLSLILLKIASAENGIELSYQEPLERFQIGYSTLTGAQQPGMAHARSMRFDAFGRHFSINLDVNRSLFDAAQRERLDPRIEIYRGDIAGVPGSWVRLVMVENVPRGMLWDGTELWAIDVRTNPATGVENPFVYRLNDLQIPPGALTCSETGIAKNAGELAKVVLAEVRESAVQGPEATSQIDVAVIGDYEFTSAQITDAAVELTTRMNNVDGIFSTQLGVQLNVNGLDTYSSNDDPFTDEPDAGLLLDELTDYRFATPAQYDNGLTHLFTGRTLEGSTAGIAYTGALCSRRYAAGLTQATHTMAVDSLIAAHELGHNFGAPHDGTSGSACEDETGGYLMAPQINGSDEFSSCSITEMEDDVSAASCISAMPSTDIAIVAGQAPSTILLGDTASLTFDANSVGSEDASGVNVDVTIPAGMTLESVSTTAGSCTDGGGTASCAIGAIASGSGVTVTLTAQASSMGDADFVASVTADADADGSNDQATISVSVEPAVDLIATAAATAQVLIDQSTTIRPGIENRSSIAATGVTLTVTPEAGITIDNASWSPGSCSIADNVVTCDAASLAAQSNTTLQVGVTGTSSGSRSYSLEVSAAEIDRDPANNNASGQVSVTSPPVDAPSNTDGGGGSAAWLSLLFLMLVSFVFAAKRRQSSPLFTERPSDAY